MLETSPNFCIGARLRAENMLISSFSGLQIDRKEVRGLPPAPEI